MDRYLAHISDDGREQSVLEHLKGTASLSERFAYAFGAAEQGAYIGWLHDIGKYSEAFQQRLHGGARVDHSTAGALECMKANQFAGSMCIAGHHAGLPDRGSRTLREGSSLMARLNRALKNGLEPYDRWKSEVRAEPPTLPEFCRNPLSMDFYIRMLYSCLVDADFLDTEAFMDGHERTSQAADFEALNRALDSYLSSWFPPKGELNRKRCAILKDCLTLGEQTERGLFTLTVPTGGGKTVASLGFALRHAKRNHMSRIIYVIPYTSIIEQNAEVFRTILGEENVLEHHSGVLFDLEEATARQTEQAKVTENWDIPVVVTTAVQFFESLYANRSSKCRKLHNIANSVIIFDEAQMIPYPYLRPCVHAIAELVTHFRASAVLCTATQPALNDLFVEFAPGQAITELCRDNLFEAEDFQRVHIQKAGKLTWEELAQRMTEQQQVLCIVNSRKNAQTLYELLEPEGAFHLSTLMCPAHRKQVLNEIRRRLKQGETCRVVATSLIEAGVDVDFPQVYREIAGLDSILQAAGRCNREGKHPAEKSIVTVFKGEGKIPPLFSVPVAAAEATMERMEDLASKAAVSDYFSRLMSIRGTDAQDKQEILPRLQAGEFPFAWIAQHFHLIESDTKTIYIPMGGSEKLFQQLQYGVHSRTLYRRLGQYGVEVYEQHYQKLQQTGALQELEDGSVILTDLLLYDPKKGLMLEPESGQALFI
jgi:CRISPR-associated endonuclease/helicase Cas3